MSTPRYLSEPEAWREIARRIAEGKWDRTGLCRERHRLFEEGRIDKERSAAMRQRVVAHIRATEDTRFNLFAFPLGEAGVRILAALFLALEAESEAV